MKIKIFSIYLVTLAVYVNHLQAFCINDLSCYQSIFLHTNNINDGSNPYLESIFNAQSSQIVYWQRWFNVGLMFRTPYDTYPKTDHVTLKQNQVLDDTVTNLKISRETFYQNQLDQLLQADILTQTSQQIKNLIITPQIYNTQDIFNHSPTNQDELINIERLLSSSSIPIEQQNLELSRIKLISGILNPILINDPSKQYATKEEEQDNHLQNWHHLTQYSVALNAFYNTLIHRITIADIGTDIAISDEFTLEKDLSPYELEIYLNHYRTQDKTWSEDLNQKSDLTLRKKYLYQLVELHHRLYQQYIERERMLAMVGTQQIQSLGFLKAWHEITNQIVALTNNSTSTTSIPTTPGIPNVPNSSGTNETFSPGTPQGGTFCFIATHIYGGNSWQVESLRAFRDQTMLASPHGQMLTIGYYLISPDICTWLDNNPQWNTPTRYVLDWLVGRIN